MNIYSGHKIIGKVENGVFIKKVKGSKHFLRKPEAICSDIEVLNQLKLLNVEYMIVVNTETDLIYSTSISTIETKGFKVNRGHNEQIGLLLKDWNVT